MQSNIQAEYMKTDNPDGSISIHFKASRGMSLTMIFFVAPLLMVTILGWIFGGLSEIGIKIDTKGVFAGVVFVIGAVAAIGFSFYYMYLNKHEFITVLPNQGLKYKDTRVAFSDIRTIGTEWDRRDQAHIYIEALGKKIRISGFMPRPVAQGVADEIKKLSGLSWN